MKTLHNERGSVIVFITFMIVILMIMVGFGLDTGVMTYTRTTGQSALDAAALSAVSGLPEAQRTNTDTPVTNRAVFYNGNNNYVTSGQNPIAATNVSYVTYNYTDNTITYDVARSAANGVRVAMETANNDPLQAPTFLTPLLRLLGQSANSANTVSVSSVATIQSRPSVPIALWSGMCGADKQTINDQIIKVQHPDKKDDENSENACWTTFLDCSSGAQDIKALFDVSAECTGTGGGDVSIGTPICQNRGQVNTTLKTAEDFFLKDNAQGWWLVPVIQGSGNCDAKNPAPIKNWALIYPTEVKSSGQDKYIKANVKCSPDYIHDMVPTNLCFTHRLVRENTKGY